MPVVADLCGKLPFTVFLILQAWWGTKILLALRLPGSRNGWSSGFRQASI